MTAVPEMVERVARALVAAGGHNPDGSVQTMNGEVPIWTLGIDQARAAIAARREPTDEMRYAGWFNRLKFRGETDEAAARMAIEKVRDHRQSWEDLSSYRASIDAALGNTEGAR